MKKSIAVIDADLLNNPRKHRFPNLALMKISSHYKSIGYQVDLKLDYECLEEYEKVYISKVFSEVYGRKVIVPEEVLNLSNVLYGGTGFFYDKADPLPYEIEHSFPDYDLYKEWAEEKLSSGESKKVLEYYINYSVGFTTRGCVRGCEFCVNKNYKKSSRHSSILEFYDPSKKYICLLDDNVFACKEWKEIFEELIGIKKPFVYKQGLDERMLNEEKIDYLFNKSKYKGDFIFAFDNIKDKPTIINKLEMISNNTDNEKQKRFYAFCAFNHDDPHVYDEEFWNKDIEDLFERVVILMKYKCVPYIMRYKDYKMSPHVGIYITLARWCNQPNMFKTKSFREYCESNQLLIKTDKICAPMQYLHKLEKDLPDVFEKYVDVKWSDFHDEQGGKII